MSSFNYEKIIGGFTIKADSNWVHIHQGDLWNSPYISLKGEEVYDIQYALGEIIRLEKEHEKQEIRSSENYWRNKEQQ